MEKGCLTPAQYSKGGIRNKCIRHGGKPVCSEIGCRTPAQYNKGGVRTKCIKHGGNGAPIPVPIIVPIPTKVPENTDDDKLHFETLLKKPLDSLDKEDREANNKSNEGSKSDEGSDTEEVERDEGSDTEEVESDSEGEIIAIDLSTLDSNGEPLLIQPRVIGIKEGRLRGRILYTVDFGGEQQDFTAQQMEEMNFNELLSVFKAETVATDKQAGKKMEMQYEIEHIHGHR